MHSVELILYKVALLGFYTESIQKIMQLGEKKKLDRLVINALYKPISPTKSIIDSFHVQKHL